MERTGGAAIVTGGLNQGQDIERSRDIRRVMQNARLTATRIQRAEDDGGDVLRINGYASKSDAPYEVFGWFGSWEETVERGAFEKSLGADPKVILRANHVDLPLAATNNQTLRLSEDDVGLWFEADLQAARGDAMDVFLGVQRGDITECSFAGWIVEFTERTDSMDWTLNEIDLDRGDVAVVSFGANPETSVDIARAGRATLALLGNRARKQKRSDNSWINEIVKLPASLE